MAARRARYACAIAWPSRTVRPGAHCGSNLRPCPAAGRSKRITTVEPTAPPIQAGPGYRLLVTARYPSGIMLIGRFFVRFK